MLRNDVLGTGLPFVHGKKLFALAILPAELQWSFLPEIIFPLKPYREKNSSQHLSAVRSCFSNKNN
jgi:hypothetical protein